jgi:glutamate---cysteine ligase / carboxylate-amine ligase
MRASPRRSPVWPTFGVELELMLIAPDDGHLVSVASSVLRRLGSRSDHERVKAEITESMIELNSAVHSSSTQLEADLLTLARAVRRECTRLNVSLCGGGSHPFRDWPLRKITQSERFNRVYETYGYLAKQFTVFGQHVHIGVADDDEAVYLTHALGALVPHFVALSAASPFQRGVDTAFQSARVNVVSAFPLSGHMPPVVDWAGFLRYFERMRSTGLVESMKDFYWDIRPKPEFGTVEVRVFDTPLSIEHAVDLAVFARACATWLSRERPPLDVQRLYEVYPVNRFRAARFGYDAEILDVFTNNTVELRRDLLHWLERCLQQQPPAADRPRLRRLARRVRASLSDAEWLRAQRRCGASFAAVMARQAKLLLKRQG